MVTEKIESLYIFTDGASRGNPGNAAIAFIIQDKKGNILKKYSESIGTTTNNIAEYTAVLRALEKAISYSKNEIFCFSDSELFVKQMKGKYKVKVKHLKELHLKVKKMEKMFKKITYTNLPREDPRIARVDRLANKELDKLEY